MGPPHNLQEDFVGSVTVGERGQVVIPAAARERCHIQPGDKLLCFVHPSGGGVAFAHLGTIAVIVEQLSNLLDSAASGTAASTGEE